ncbi:MAG: hypothetical protein LBK25_05305 [Treponema sp.]|nr:hypothetical protein [Treponema sp.]
MDVDYHIFSYVSSGLNFFSNMLSTNQTIRRLKIMRKYGIFFLYPTNIVGGCLGFDGSMVEVSATRT